MSIFSKSVLLWLGGSIVGALIAHHAAKRQGSKTFAGKHPALGAAGGALLGAAVVGGIGDKVLENRRDYGTAFPKS